MIGTSILINLSILRYRKKVQSESFDLKLNQTQPAFTGSESAVETWKQCVKFSLRELTLNKFHTLFWCFHS